MENNLNPNKNPSKYDDLIKLRKAKLEKMRKERLIFNYEKTKRDTKDNLNEILLKTEISDKVKLIDDKEIDKIENEIKKLSENLNGNLKQELKPETSDKSLSKNKTLNLQCSSLQITEFPPIVKPKYSKHTQTEHSRLYKGNDTSLNKNSEEDDLEYQDEVSPLKLKYTFSSILPPGLLSPGLPNITDIEPALTPTNNKCPWNYVKEKQKDTLPNNCENLLDSEDFHKSLKRVSLAMEKILSCNKNICIDYINGPNGDMYLDNNALLKLNHIFYNENLTQNRCVTSIDLSPHCAGEIATSYYKNLDSPSSLEDVIIWNQNFNPHNPEHVFHSHSSVTAVCFTKFNENLIIGATYSGQIVLWDKRVNSSIALRSTKLNYKAHTQPIHCLRVIDDNDSSHNLISISSDGKLCLWNLDMLAVPLDVMQLELKISEAIKKPIAVTCMDFPANGVNNLVFGSEDGCAYTAFRYGYETCINDRYEKHDAPITSISAHYNQTTSEFENLFLTSSIDGAINLWSLDNVKPLHTIKNNYDYAMDVAWSPQHPAVFVTGDGNGCLDLYNLNENLEEPIESLNTKQQTAINRLKWNSNGQQIAVGTEKGELYLYKVAEELANPSSGEWNRFNNVIKDIKRNYHIESEE